MHRFERQVFAMAGVDPELDLAGMIWVPFLAVFGGLVVMILSTNALRFIASGSTWAMTKGELGRAVAPVLKSIKTIVEAAGFNLTGLKFGMEEVLLCAILIVLAGIWRNSSRQVAALQKSRNAGAADDSKAKRN